MGGLSLERVPTALVAHSAEAAAAAAAGKCRRPLMPVFSLIPAFVGVSSRPSDRRISVEYPLTCTGIDAQEIRFACCRQRLGDCLWWAALFGGSCHDVELVQ